MNRPQWATFIGVIFIVFGGCGIINNSYTINLPDIIKTHKEMVDTFTDSIFVNKSQKDSITITEKSDSTNISNIIETPVKKGITKFYNNFFGKSDWLEKAFPIIGLIGILISALFVISGRFLLMKKHYAIKLVYIILTIALLFSISKFLLVKINNLEGFIGISFKIGSIISFVIDLILLIVVISGNKEAYKKIDILKK